MLMSTSMVANLGREIGDHVLDRGAIADVEDHAGVQLLAQLVAAS